MMDFYRRDYEIDARTHSVLIEWYKQIRGRERGHAINSLRKVAIYAVQ